jgi:uncharacterized protein YdiU (UPF0061 family)
MDKIFLEFWGNLLLATAKGQAQLQDLSHWMDQGMSGSQPLNDLFRKFYGVDRQTQAADPLLDTARRAFAEAFRAYLKALGAVPQSDYAELEKQREALQKKTEEQEALIRKLRLELSESRLAQGDVVRGFQQLVQVQNDQFQKLTESFSDFFTGGRHTPEK